MAEFDLKAIMERAGGFSPNAYKFIRDGLGHTVGLIHGPDALEAPPSPEDESRHVTGQQLCLGLRDYAISRYGVLAKTVLNHWGLRTTEDFGKIVFALVEAGLMRKTDEDTLEDFQGVYDFDEEFAETFEDSIGASD